MISSSIKGQIRVLFGLQYLALARENRFVGHVDNYSEIGVNDIIAYAAKAVSIPESNIRMSLESVFDALNYYVTEGHAVELPGIGIFSFGIKGKATYNEKDAAKSAQLVQVKRINFRPSKEIVTMMDNIRPIVSFDTNGRELSLSPQVQKVQSIYGDAAYLTNWSISWAKLVKSGYPMTVFGANLDGATASIVCYGEDGNTSVETFPLTFQKKSQWIVNLASADPDQYVGVSGLSIEKDGQIIKQFDFVNENAEPSVSEVKLNGVKLVANIVNSIAKAGTYNLVLSGVRPTECSNKIDEQDIVFQSNNRTSASAVLNVTSDNFQLVIDGKVYDVTLIAGGGGGGGTTTAINTLSANGVTVANGGTSTIIAGSTYNFHAVGTGLAGITSAQIIGPGTVSNVVATANQLDFTFTASGAGQLKIAGVYTVTLTAATSSITSIGGIANGGTLEGTGDAVIVGSVPASATVTATGAGNSASFNAERNKLTIMVASAGTVIIKDGDTTIFTLNIKPVADGSL